MKFTCNVFIILLAIFISIHDIPEMKKQKSYKEITLYVIILFSGVTLTILKANGVELPNPSDVIVAVNSPVVSMLKGALE